MSSTAISLPPAEVMETQALLPSGTAARSDTCPRVPFLPENVTSPYLSLPPIIAKFIPPPRMT